jgi:hypothetical protein
MESGGRRWRVSPLSADIYADFRVSRTVFFVDGLEFLRAVGIHDFSHERSDAGEWRNRAVL